MNHFEVHLIVSSREVDSKDSGWPPNLSIFSDKRQNGKCNVRNFRFLSFGVSPDVLAFKVRVLTSDFKF